ncbi:MAG: acetyl-CoA carboxylase carboxyltransferase subunit alpha [Candidatus Hydrogenedentes bacterium]|nr:acetyl-CoA carboxylase carboxyltransferase subunit alpha [Candidatus Hydrogenedentota bacterium]
MSVSHAEPRNRTAFDYALPFERRIAELHARLAGVSAPAEKNRLLRELDREQKKAHANLTAWQRVQLARHPLRPRMLDYVKRLFEDFVELHGDRLSGDDPAMVGGIARFNGRSLVVVGQQKGSSTDERITRNYGMSHPEGYRKALRLFEMAERLKLPVVSFVDTPAAHPGIEAERGGQGPAIARNLLELMGIRTSVFCVVLGEGGSGGALAIAIGDRIAMFESAIYVVCPPERCAEILWRDVDKKELAASVMRVTANDLLDLGVIDVVLPEPGGGAHWNPDGAAEVLAKELELFLRASDEGKWSPELRRERFRRMGVWKEVE